MILHVDGVERTGPALDTRDLDIAPTTLVDVVRNPSDARICCPEPKRVHQHVGLVHPERTISRRTALAAAARTRGESSRVDDRIAAIEAELDELDPPTADVPAAVQAVAEAASEVDAHRDRVARLGGIVAARDDPGAVDQSQAELRAAAAVLAETETTLHAAEQALARERERQRAANDAREYRLRLRDRLENLERDARRELATRSMTLTERALDAIPDWPAGTDDARWSLAVARTAQLRAPIIVADGPFRTPVQARACLAAPVVLA